MFFHNFIIAPGTGKNWKFVLPNGADHPYNFIITQVGSPLSKITTLKEAIAASKNGEFINCQNSGVCVYANSVVPYEM